MYWGQKMGVCEYAVFSDQAKKMLDAHSRSEHCQVIDRHSSTWRYQSVPRSSLQEAWI